MATMLSGITPTNDVITTAATRRAMGSERAFGATDLAGNSFTGAPSSLFLPVEGTATDGGLTTDVFSPSTLAFAQTRADPAATGLLAEGLVEDQAADINQLSLPFGDAGETNAAAQAVPPPPPGSAAAQAEEADELAYVDPLDTNRDGSVSEMERFMASLEDPATAANDALAFPAATDAGVIANPATAQANALYSTLAAQPLGREELGSSLDVTA